MDFPMPASLGKKTKKHKQMIFPQSSPGLSIVDWF
jgi:hypothetical protein